MRRRFVWLVRVLLFVVPSFVAAAVLMAYLAADASRLSFTFIRAEYSSQEELAAVCAHHRGDMDGAARHYANVVATYADGGWWHTTLHTKGWPMSFPLAAIVLGRAWSAEVLGLDMPRVEASYRVRLANVLTAQGRTDLASKELAHAANLWGADGDHKVAVLREKLAGIEDDTPLVELCRSSEPVPR